MVKSGILKLITIEKWRKRRVLDLVLLLVSINIALVLGEWSYVIRGAFLRHSPGMSTG